jgi:hypothetical protein
VSSSKKFKGNNKGITPKYLPLKKGFNEKNNEWELATCGNGVGIMK